MDNAFLSNFTKITEDNLGDPDFNVEKIAKKMNMSYSSLWRRVSKYTGKSANQLIREIRLQKAQEILMKEDITIAQVAFRTGFSSPNYFSTCFQDFFGYSPGELKKLDGTNNGRNETLVEGKIGEKPSKPRLAETLKKIKISKRVWVPAIISLLAVVIAIAVIESNRNNKKSIAVLFPTNLSHDAQTESFCGGLQDQLLNALFEIDELEVKSRVGTDRFRNTTMQMPKIGRMEKANYIVESNVNRTDNDITVRIRLIKSKKDRNVWTKPYQRKMEDQFKLQDEIVKDAVREITRVLLPEKTAPVKDRNANNPEAESFLNQGKHYSDLLKLNIDRAYDCYFKALKIDSTCAEAYLGIASTLNHMYSDIENRHDSLLTASFSAIEKAAEINGSLPGLHNQRGMALFLLGNFSGAVDEYNDELEIDHESNEALMNISKAYMSMGMWDKAENSMNELHQRESYSTLPNYLLGYFYELQRDFRNAKTKYQLASSRNPTHGPSLLGRTETLLKSGNGLPDVRSLLDSLVYKDYNSYPDSLSMDYEYAILDIYQGRYEDAIEIFSHWKRVTAKSPPYYFRPKHLLQAQAFGYLNEHPREWQYYDSARVFIEDLQQLSEGVRNEPRVNSALGIVYAGLGQREKALECAVKTKELLTTKPDAWLGPYAMEDVAFIYAETGNYTEAFSILRKLLTDPGPLSFSLLEIDPRWASLREQAEYRELKEEFGLKSDR